MPEHLRALVVILGLGLATFWLAAKPMCANVTGIVEYRRRRNAWLAMTTAAFVVGNFWIYILAGGALAVFYGAREKAPLALYCTLLLVIPQNIAHELPGVGPIRYFFLVDHVRLLNLVLLLPLAIRLAKMPPQPHSRLPDRLVAGLILFVVLQQALATSITSTIRTAFDLMVDIWLPFFVASRALRELRDFREMAGALVVTCSVLGLLAVYEAVNDWLLYFSLRSELGLRPAFYTVRGDGTVRAEVTATQPIVLGYVLVVGLAMLFYVAPLLRSRWAAWLAALSAYGGLLASLSRGPWVGAAAMILTTLCVGPGRLKRTAVLACTVGVVLLFLSLSPYGAYLLDLLPFIGQSDAGSVEYRLRLLDVSLEVLRQNLLFGDVNFLSNPLMEQMRQGQGIIDMVNSFLQVGLAYGIIGLALFCGAFLVAIGHVWSTRRARVGDAEIERLGRALLAALVGIVVTISTVSSIGVVPTIFWLMIGAAVAYSRAFAAAVPAAVAGKTVASPTQPTAAASRSALGEGA